MKSSRTAGPGALRRPGFNYLNWLPAAAIGAAFFVSANYVRFDVGALADPSSQKAVGRLIGELWPPELSVDFLRFTARLAIETVAISIVGTVLAVVAAVPLSLLALRTRGEEVSRAAQGTVGWLWRWALYYLGRLTLNLARAIPELVWALLFVVAVGLGPFAGALALAIHSAGVLGKLYAEIFESVDQRLVESVRSTGASELQVVALARIPITLPVLLSYTLFRWECNMRAATVLGFVGAGGIGTQLVISMKLFAYSELLTLMGAILFLITFVDLAGQLIRMRLLDAPRVTASRPQQRRCAIRRLAAFFGQADR